MSYNSSVYNDEYYKSHCGDNYARGNGWEEVFARLAARIVKELNPETVLDVGCAYGYLVEGLRDLGVKAFGIDVSDYAISNAREDIRPFCNVRSATERIAERYDLITCIEVMEHLSPDDLDAAITNMCNASDLIIFSSTPFDYNEESHYSVNPPSFWAEKFAYNGFYHDISYDCSYVSVQAMLFRKVKRSNIDLVRSYEAKLFNLWQENCMIRHRLNLATVKTIELEHLNNELKRELDNREHGFTEELRKKEDTASKLLEDVTRKYESQLEAQSLSLKKRYSDLLRLEYIKRDTAEEKLICARKRNDFLESELWNAKCELESRLAVIESLNSKVSELDLYRDELLIYKSFAESDAVKTRIPLKGRISHIFRFIASGRKYWDPVFNTEDYLRYNPDVREKIPHTWTRLLWHFIRYGMKEGRRAAESFDVHAYRRYNPDVAAMSRKNLRTAYYHYIEYGQKEQRRTK